MIIQLKDGRVFNLGQFGGRDRSIESLIKAIESTRDVEYRSNESEAFGFLSLASAAGETKIDMLQEHYLDKAIEVLPKITESARIQIDASLYMADILDQLSEKFPQKMLEWRGA